VAVVLLCAGSCSDGVVVHISRGAARNFRLIFSARSMGKFVLRSVVGSACQATLSGCSRIEFRCWFRSRRMYAVTVRSSAFAALMSRLWSSGGTLRITRPIIRSRVLVFMVIASCVCEAVMLLTH
jgi:hypothetical protein